MRRPPDRVLLATATLLVASMLLIGPSLLGLGGSLALALALAAVGVGLFTLHDRLAAIGPIAGVPVGAYLAALWAGPLVGALLVLLRPDATPGELQALGGLAGLAGMANYFLRPVYGLAFALGRSLRRTLG